jgi:hypothetical protein
MIGIQKRAQALSAAGLLSSWPQHIHQTTGRRSTNPQEPSQHTCTQLQRDSCKPAVVPTTYKDMTCLLECDSNTVTQTHSVCHRINHTLSAPQHTQRHAALNIHNRSMSHTLDSIHRHTHSRSTVPHPAASHITAYESQQLLRIRRTSATLPHHQFSGCQWHLAKPEMVCAITRPSQLSLANPTHAHSWGQMKPQSLTLPVGSVTTRALISQQQQQQQQQQQACW